MSIEYAIELDGLTRRFGDFTAVDQVSLRIPKGCLYGFLGLNGAGKTTTIRMLTTLLPPSAGVARLWGQQLSPTDPLAVRSLGGTQTSWRIELAKASRHGQRASISLTLPAFAGYPIRKVTLKRF